jgi:hypothetical protein
MRHTDQHMQKLSTTGPPLMPVQRSDPGPKSCPAAAVDPYHAGQTDGKRASCFAREAKPPAHRAAHESRLIRCQQKEPVKSAAADHLLGPALHGRSGRVSKRCGASRAGSWGGRRWATRPSAAMASTSPFYPNSRAERGLHCEEASKWGVNAHAVCSPQRPSGSR